MTPVKSYGIYGATPPRLPKGLTRMGLTHYNGVFKIRIQAPDLTRRRLPLATLCRICMEVFQDGHVNLDTDLPLPDVLDYRCSSGHIVTMPDLEVAVDSETGREYTVHAARTVSGITAGGLTMSQGLSLLSVAQAVVDGNAPETALAVALATAPPSVGALRPKQRMTRSDWISLAGVIVALMAFLIPLLMNDGQVTEQQLLEVIEHLAEQKTERVENDPQPQPQGGAGSEHEAPILRGAPTDMTGLDQTIEQREDPEE